jgi:hypothetical protein
MVRITPECVRKTFQRITHPITPDTLHSHELTKLLPDRNQKGRLMILSTLLKQITTMMESKMSMGTILEVHTNMTHQARTQLLLHPRLHLQTGDQFVHRRRRHRHP